MKYKTTFRNILILYILIVNFAYAQKIPNIQTTSLKIPDNIKFDGKANKWNNNFQAYNHATNLYYSIANNDKLLYLIFQIKQPDIITKVFLGGVTLTISSAINPQKFKTSVTYPVFIGQKAPLYSIFKNKPKKSNDSIQYAMQVDSFIYNLNNTFLNNLKLIIVEKNENATDTISIYNQQGIKVASRFDNNFYFTCEIGIPIKLFDQSSSASEYNYNIRLNGSSVQKGKIQFSSNGRFIIISNAQGKPVDAIPVIPETMNTTFPTDFGGKYKMLK
ncbi:hypothetical protein [Mucilaginibacter gracilis]|nr:hypothetical protein [Mucilaginibacter gracilis]